MKIIITHLFYFYHFTTSFPIFVKNILIMKITLVQQEILWGRKAENLAAFDNEVHKHYHKTDLLVLPEMFSTGFSVDTPEQAEMNDGETFHYVKQWAFEGNFAVTGSVMATDDGTKFYNRAFFCQPDGTTRFADKRHLFFGPEQKYFAPGNTFLDVRFREVKIRVLVCYDLRFPVWARNSKENPYDLLIYVANWPKDRIDIWETLTKARAIENEAYVCGVNIVGTDAYKIQYNGHSLMHDPRGKTIFELEDELTAKTGEIDLDYLTKVRQRLPYLKSADNFTINI